MATRTATSTTSVVVDIDTTGEVQFKRAAISGDITVEANANTATIGANVVTNDKSAQMAADTVKVNNKGSTANATELAMATSTVLGRGPTGHIDDLAVNATLAISDTGLGRAALTGDVTASAGSNATTIAANAVTNAKAAQMATMTVKGNVTGNMADATDIDIGLLPIGSRHRPATAIVPYVYSNSILDNDPTATKFKFDSLTLGSITKLWIDPLNANSIDQTFDIKLMQSGDQIIVMNPAMTTVYTTFTTSSAYTDKTGYYEFSGAASDGTLPTNGASVMLVYVSKGLSQSILAIDHFARFEDDGTGGLRFIDNTGAVVTGVPAVYALASAPVSGVTELPAASTFPLGTEVRIHPDCFVGTGHNPLGIKLVSDGTNWNPAGPQMMFRARFGTLATPTLTASAIGKFSIPVDPVIPYGLLRDDSVLVFKGLFRKNGTDATSALVKGYLGTNATYSSNSQFYQQTVTATTDNIDFQADTKVLFTTVATVVTATSTRNMVAMATNLIVDVNTNLSYSADMIFSLAVTALTGSDNVDCLEYELWLE